MVEVNSTMVLAGIVSIVGSVVGFLIMWAAKHMLDRLVLPRYLDWWASRNKKRSTKRFKAVVRRYRYIKTQIDKPNLILVEVARRFLVLVTACLGVGLSIFFGFVA